MRAYWRWELETKSMKKPALSPVDLALIHLQLGNREEALGELDRSLVGLPSWQTPFLRVEPMMDPLRGDPRFRSLLARLDRRSRPSAAPF